MLRVYIRSPQWFYNKQQLSFNILTHYCPNIRIHGSISYDRALCSMHVYNAHVQHAYILNVLISYPIYKKQETLPCAGSAAGLASGEGWRRLPAPWYNHVASMEVSYSTSLTLCIAAESEMSCGELPGIANGYVKYSLDGSSASYVCNDIGLVLMNTETVSYNMLP